MKMTKLCLDLLREHTENRITRMKKHVERIDSLEPNHSSNAVYMELANISRQAELLAQEMRAVVVELHAGLEALGLVPQYIPLPNAPDVQISEKDGIFKIKMDGMLPFSSKGGVYYLHEKLYIALSDYCSRNALLTPLFDSRCAIVFLHHYNTEQSKVRHIRDYDNLEYSCVLNAIAQHFLWDDNPESYVSVHEIVADSSNFTEVLIMKISDFKHLVSSENELDSKELFGKKIE